MNHLQNGARSSFVQRHSRLKMIAITIFCVSLLTAASTLWIDKSVAWNFGDFDPVLVGCGNDGWAYCKMALGQWAPSPYARRILTPSIVSLMPSTISLPIRFKIINLIALGISILLTGLLTLRICDLKSLDPMRARWGAVISGSLLMILPQFGFRWINFYPALVDAWASVFALGWVLLLFSHRPILIASAPFALFMASMTRESWIPVGVVASFLLLITKPPKSIRNSALLSCGAAVCAFILIIRIDTVPVGYSLSSANSMLSWNHQMMRGVELIQQHFMTATGLQTTFWQTVFSFGFLPWLTIQILPRSFWTFSDESVDRRLVFFCLSLVGLNWVVGVFGTNDIHRITSAAAPELMAVVATTLVLNSTLEIKFLWLFAASLVLWNPFYPTLDGTQDNYHFVFAPIFLEGETTPRLIRDTVRVVPVLIVWWYFHRRKKHTKSEHSC